MRRLIAGPRSRRRRRFLVDGQRGAQASGLGFQARGLGCEPCGVPGDGLGRDSRGAIDLLGPAARRGGGSFLVAGGPERGSCLGLGSDGPRVCLGGTRCRAGGGRSVGREPVDVCLHVEAAAVRLEKGCDLADDEAAIPGDGEPAGRQCRLQLEARGGVRKPHDPPDQSGDRAHIVSAEGIDEPSAPARADGLVQRFDGRVRARVARKLSRGLSERLCHHDRPALRRDVDDGGSRQHLGPTEPGKRRIDRWLHRRLDGQSIGDRAAAPGPRCAAERPAFRCLEGSPRLVQAGADRADGGARRSRTIGGRARRGFRLGEQLPRPLAIVNGRRFRRDARRQLARRPGACLARCLGASARRRRSCALLRSLPFRVGRTPPSGFSLLCLRELQPTEGSGIDSGQTRCRGSAGSDTGARDDRRDLGIERRQLGLEIGGRGRDGQSEGVARRGQLRLGSLSRLHDPRPLAPGAIHLGRVPRLTQLEGRARRAPPIQLGARLRLQRRLPGERSTCGADGLLVAEQLGHRPLDRPARRDAGGCRCGRATAGLVPAGMGRQEDRRRELVCGAEPVRLLLRLLAEPPCLRPELGKDVVDARQIRLGLRELLLCATASALVPAHAGDLFEQRPRLLGPERQRLVDHALADEQEGILGEVPGIEQVDQVLEPHPLAVEQVVVLARAVQPPAELDDAVLDR